jgi:hypothetical protein
VTANAVLAGQLLGRSRTGSSQVNVAIAGTASSGIPPHEQWLYRNNVALKMVRDGIEDLRHGRVRDLGSFAKHAVDDNG